MNINKYKCVGCYIRLSQTVVSQKVVVNVQCEAIVCFAWSVVAALFPLVENVILFFSCPHNRSVLNINDLIFPIIINQLRKFEMDNDILINILTMEEEKERV